jgi:hypothetical protein
VDARRGAVARVDPRRGDAQPRGSARRDRRRVAAQHRRDDDRDAGGRRDRGGVQLDLARLRGRRRARPLRPDRTRDALRRRRLLLRRQDRSTASSGCATIRAALALGAARRGRGAATSRRGPVGRDESPTTSPRHLRRAAAASDAPRRRRERRVRAVRFDHPWYVLFSSGTTGVPKCIVHRTGGVLLQHLKEHQLHCDIRPGDRVAYYTTCGWMMWNWLASVPASGATAVLYDGSPFHPGPDAMTDARRARRNSRSLASAPSTSTRCARPAIRAASTTTTSATAHDRLDRLAARARIVRVGESRRSRPASTWPRSRAAPTCALLRRRRSDEHPPTPARSSVPAWAWRSTCSTSTGDPAGSTSAANSCARPVPVDAARLLGRRRRVALPGRLLRQAPRHLEPRRLRVVDRRTAA